MDTINKRTLADQVYEVLKKEIMNQELAPGSKVTLKLLQERFKLSSTPIREAMSRLSHEGLIDHVTNKGAHIIQFNQTDIIEIYELCKTLDLAAFKYACQRENSLEFIHELDKCLQSQNDALLKDDLAEFRIHSDNFHDLFYKYANNTRLYESAKKIRNQLSILTCRYCDFEILQNTTYLQHEEIFKEISHNNFENAMKLLQNHFDEAKERILKEIK